MQQAATSKEEILEKSREILRDRGLRALNIRSVAQAAGVSVGCLYNYFASKAELVVCTMETIWAEVFGEESGSQGTDLLSVVSGIMERLEQMQKKYPGFLQKHAAGFEADEKTEARGVMARNVQKLKSVLTECAARDPRIRADAFSDSFTAAVFADLLFSELLGLALTGKLDPDPVCELIRRAVYRPDSRGDND